MDFSKANIAAHTYADEPQRLSAVEYTLEDGDRKPYIGADGSVGMLKRGGWLSLKTEPFDGWQTTVFFDIQSDATALDIVAEVSRNFHQPSQDGEWLRFPVIVRSVERFSE